MPHAALSVRHIDPPTDRLFWLRRRTTPNGLRISRRNRQQNHNQPTKQPTNHATTSSTDREASKQAPGANTVTMKGETRGNCTNTTYHTIRSPQPIHPPSSAHARYHAHYHAATQLRLPSRSICRAARTLQYAALAPKCGPKIRYSDSTVNVSLVVTFTTGSSNRIAPTMSVQSCMASRTHTHARARAHTINTHARTAHVQPEFKNDHNAAKSQRQTTTCCC